VSVLGLAKAAVRLEWNIYVSLARWAFRRPAVPAGGTALGYARMVTPVLALWIFGSAAETVAIHFIVPWEIPRLVLDVLDRAPDLGVAVGDVGIDGCSVE